MRSYLVVANQTLQRAELADELRKRIEEGPSSFYLLVPDTQAADYPDVAAAAGGLQPSMTWWMTDYRGPATDEEASTQARQRLGQMLADLDALGIPVEGDLGSAQPVEAMEKTFTDHRSPVRRDHRGHAAPPRLALAASRPAPEGRAPVRAAGHDHHHQALALSRGRQNPDVNWRAL
jgi:hypothetical protein